MKSETRTARPPSTRISRVAPSHASTDTCVPLARVSRGEASARGVDARAMFVFGFVDDKTPVFELLTLCGLPLDEAAEALASLCDVGAVSLRAGDASEGDETRERETPRAKALAIGGDGPGRRLASGTYETAVLRRALDEA